MTAATAATFRDLHRAGRPLVLPNAWDHASAAALAAEGFPAIGTTSLGVAAANGLPDGRGLARDATVALAWRLCHLPSLVTVDIEGGFSDDPAEVAELAVELARAGAVGVNIEDGREETRLAEPAHQAELIAAVKARAPELFVNARVDTYWLDTDGEDTGTGDTGGDRLAVTLRRAERYVAAGADGIFVPSLPDDAHIGAVVAAVDVPLNVLYQPGRHTLDRLAELGVGRLSTGSLLFRAAVHAATEAACAIRAGGRPAVSGAPTYADAQRLAEG